MQILNKLFIVLGGSQGPEEEEVGGGAELGKVLPHTQTVET